MVIPIFNEKIAVYKYDNIDKFKGKEELKKIVDSFYDVPEIKNGDATERYGNASSSVTMCMEYPVFETFKLDNFEVGAWIRKQISIAAKDLGFDRHKNVDKYNFIRSWSNRMYKDSHGAAHKHMTGCDMVCIFYYEAPPGSSELVFINDDLATKNTDPWYTYPDEKRYHFKPEPGSFVCHFPGIPHAVAQHKCDDTRTVMVFEPKFTYKPVVTGLNKLKR